MQRKEHWEQVYGHHEHGAAVGAFALWHDRAVFHFLTRAEDRALYVESALRSVRPAAT